MAVLPPSPAPSVGASGQRRLSGRLLLAAIVVVLLVVAAVVVATRKVPDGLRVVETGFSEVVRADPVPNEPDDLDNTVSWVVVVENVTDRVAVDAGMRFRLLDESGRVVDEGSRNLPLVLPHQRAVVANTALGDLTGVADVELELSQPSQWEDPTAATDPGLTIGDLTVGYGVENQPVVGFTVSAEHVVATYEWVVVCRDPDGRLLAGWSGTSERRPELALGDDGTVSQTELGLYSVPDLGSVEVYVAPTDRI